MKSGYTGKIKNAGAQIVSAPFQATGKVKGAKVVTGKDLRSGK